MGLFDPPPYADKPQQPPLINPATLDRVILHVTWVKSLDELPYPNTTGHTHIEKIGDDWHAYVMCMQPTDFNDLDRLETLGHECWHALGAMHENDAP